MARVKFAEAIAADLLFASTAAPVRISGVWYDPLRGELEFEIHGPDVPNARRVDAIIAVESNRAGQRLERMHFKVIE